jgi:WD40 repeat protein
MTVGFSPDGRLIATGSHDHSIRLWDVTSHSCAAVLSDHTSVVSSVAFSPDGHSLISGSFDKTARQWDVTTCSCTATWTGQFGAVACVAFCPNVRVCRVVMFCSLP